MNDVTRPEIIPDRPRDLDSDSESILFHRHPRARRYLIRVLPDGRVRVTVPRGGTRDEALAFVRRSANWIARRRAAQAERAARPPGVLFKGEPVEPRFEEEDGRRVLVLPGHRVLVGPGERDPVHCARRFLCERSSEELPARTRELAAQFGIPVRRVTIRNQRSRWGSCSTGGTVSLNWRLVQAPDWVRDYVIVHELMHRREMNHSPRFWAHVESAFPRAREARAWLRRHGRQLLD